MILFMSDNITSCAGLLWPTNHGYILHRL